MIIALQKLRITSLSKFQEKILAWLQSKNVGQIEKPKELNLNEAPETKESLKIEYQLAGIKFALSYLLNYKTKEKKSLVQKLQGNKIKISEKEILETIKKFDYPSLIEAVQNGESLLNQIKNETLKLKDEKERLSPWQKLPFGPGQKETLKTKIILAAIGLKDFDNFLVEITNKVPESEIVSQEKDDKQIYFLVFYQKTKEKELEAVLAQYKATIVELPYPDMLPSRALKNIDKRISELNNEERLQLSRLKRYASDHGKLQIVYDWLTWEAEKNKAAEKLARTGSAFTMDIWIEKARFHEINRQLSKITKNNLIIEKLPLPDDPNEIPVTIRNQEFITPFEAVTGLYGMPKTQELDPTPFLAPFFIIFFALCLSDAGYGIVLALISFAFIKIAKVPKENQKLFRLLIYCGLATVIVGALFGGWFGIDFDSLPRSWFKSLALKVKVIDPIKNSIVLLVLSLGLGIIQIISGIAVRMYWQFKQKEYLKGILDSGLWILFISSLVAWLVTKQVAPDLAIKTILKYSTITFALALVFTQGRDRKNPFLKIGSGIISLYSLVAYMGDMLSYSRLLALGLATGIIALVVNLIAIIFKDMLPGILGFLAAGIILLIGHLFNLAINVLGSFIHSSRLQFVEFFPKFMEGGGPRFKPLKRESKYVELTNE